MIEIEINNDVIIFRLSGIIDISNTSSLFKSIKNEIEESAKFSIIFDLQKVDFIESVGIGAFINLHQLYIVRNKKPYRMALVNINKSLQQLFYLLNLQEISFFNFFLTEAEGISYVLEKK